MWNTLSWQYCSLESFVSIESFLSSENACWYQDWITNALIEWCTNENKLWAYINIRINSSTSGLRRHTDWVLGALNPKLSYNKYAITLQWPWTLVLNQNPSVEIYEQATDLQRQLSQALQGNEFEENEAVIELQKLLNALFDNISFREADIGELIKRKIGKDSEFHSEPIIGDSQSRVFFQFIPFDLIS